MTLLVPDVGERQILKSLTSNVVVENLQLKLYTSNTTPAEADITSTYTEATGFGYAAITLTGATWTFVAGAPSHADYPQQTFTFTGALGNVYGYFVVGLVSGILFWAERFTDGPYNIVNNGDAIKITPYIEAA